ncbi:hypothetical protein HMPREF0765_4884 [Sphingobacterium spiritivorum ATCC 33300]|uniref:Uncharacterized protein n=1 Tax=Sphingobacterium spiritivorum ATCC 33300 TaxID=525372 RepID=C2G5M8_SPHSI|nr:hypothetical protein HMPREF0765_4884 [Sphingobacterium spiritivorum ATCC 33300]
MHSNQNKNLLFKATPNRFGINLGYFLSIKKNKRREDTAMHNVQLHSYESMD